MAAEVFLLYCTAKRRFLRAQWVRGVVDGLYNHAVRKVKIMNFVTGPCGFYWCISDVHDQIFTSFDLSVANHGN